MLLTTVLWQLQVSATQCQETNYTAITTNPCDSYPLPWQLNIHCIYMIHWIQLHTEEYMCVFWAFLDILWLDLKRFSGYGLRSKLDTSINIPHTLNVSNYISKSDISGTPNSLLTPLHPLITRQYLIIIGTEYELYAVSNHSGTVYFGHYTAWCKHYLTNKWYSYNDGQ